MYIFKRWIAGILSLILVLSTFNGTVFANSNENEIQDEGEAYDANLVESPYVNLEHSLYDNDSNFSTAANGLWGIIGKVITQGGKKVVKVDKKTFKKQNPSKAKNAVSNFKTVKVDVGKGEKVGLTKGGMNHILVNHHPAYWTGANKTTVHYAITIPQMKAKIVSILNANRHLITNRRGYAEIVTRIDGKKYKLIVKKWQVTTFYPVG